MRHIAPMIAAALLALPGSAGAWDDARALEERLRCETPVTMDVAPLALREMEDPVLKVRTPCADQGPPWRCASCGMRWVPGDGRVWTPYRP